MLTFIGFTFLVTVIVAIYAVWGRKWLRTKTWGAAFLEAIEPMELALFGKSMTLLWARFWALVNMIYFALTWLGALDVTPFLMLVPDKWRPWVTATPFAALALAGFIQEVLRRGTTQPLALVAVPENAPEDVQVAVERAAFVTDEAIGTVTEARETALKVAAASKG